MRPEDYPAQEPFTELGGRYHAEVMRLGLGVVGVDIVHGANPYQSVGFYPAPKPRGDVLCLIHGGGWTNGYKEWMAFMAPALNERGITVASLGYRLAPQHVWPANFEDCADGIAAVRANASQYGGDWRRIFVGGHSAGGHLAAMLGLRTDWQGRRGLTPDALCGVLPISGTFLFGPDSGLSMRPRFLGDPALENDAPASPMNHIHGKAPPFHVAWGEKDFPHLRIQSVRFVEQLRAAGVVVESLEMPGCDHLGASYESGRKGSTWVEAADRFMASQGTK